MAPPDFPGNHNLNRDTGFQAVLELLDFKLARFRGDDSPGTGRRPVSQKHRWHNPPIE